MQYFGFDPVKSMMNGELSPKMALHLLYQLPEDSRFVGMERGGPEFIGWTKETYLRAATVDVLQYLLHSYQQAHSKRKVPEPKPVKRPDKREKTMNLFEFQLKQQLDRLKAEE